MNTGTLGYHSSISSLSNSTRTSLGSAENLLSAHFGPAMINSNLAFGNDVTSGYRLDMLQQIANRVQRDSLACEDKLILARNALQSDAKRLESGLQFQNEPEIAAYLLECENLLRQQVIDVQVLHNEKYYQADQLVQRVAKLRDDLMDLRSECTALYSKGRTLTSEQTKLMISGITQSLNAGYSQNLNPSLNVTLSQGLTPSLSPALTSDLTSNLTPSLTPSLMPTFPTSLKQGLIQNYGTGVETNALQTLKFMQIRKPLMKSAISGQNLTEEEVNMKFVQDLLTWVEEMQTQLDRAEWGSDMPSVQSHLDNHTNFHRAIEEFESSLKEAKLSELQMTPPLKLGYSEKLSKLESQYAKLLNTSRYRERHLDSLYAFVSRATHELIGLNEKEEEEVAYDWSDRNSSISRKKEYHADLMRELDQKEEVIKSVQETADQLLTENHPARLTIEAYRAAMQTQWSWILQLCNCVEQHLRENQLYFEFFNDAKEAMDYLKNLKETIQRKYTSDRSSSLHKLEDLVQESMEEKEQLLQYRSVVAGLVGRAKLVVQLKPRNPDNPVKTSIPIKAICDYRQIEITIYKDDECVLANNSHRAKWKVISPTGNEAMVPSVCFSVPPPNKEAIDNASRIEQLYQNVLALWHQSHVNMKSVVAWNYLVNELEAVRDGNVASIKTMLPGEHPQVLSNLQARFEEFLEESRESQVFTVADTAQLEREVQNCKQYYEELLKSAEREEHEESVYNLYVSEIRNIHLHLDNCEERLIRQIRTPLERDDLQESVIRISEQEKLKKELERLQEDVEKVSGKCEIFFSQAASSPSVPTLRSELNAVIQNMDQVFSMSSIYLEKLKVVYVVLKNTQGAESLVKLYETKLCEDDAVTADPKDIDNLILTLKQWRSEVDEKRDVFHALEDELQKAKAISDQMLKAHKERDLDLDWHKEKVDQLVERWQNVHCQIESRLRDLDSIGESLKHYQDTYHSLDQWVQDVENMQHKLQERQLDDSKSLADQLNKQKMLVSEIEMKQNKIDECQRYSEQYSSSLKDYELQVMTYRAMVDSQQKSPVKRRRMQSSADTIMQEFMDLRTRYTALVTLMTQYVKFASDALKRTEQEENAKCKDSSVHLALSEHLEHEKVMNLKLRGNIKEFEQILDELRKQKHTVEEELYKIKASAETEKRNQSKVIEEINLQKTKAEYESKQYCLQLEKSVKEKAAAEQELEHVSQLTLQAEAKRNALEKDLRAFKREIEEGTLARRKIEQQLNRKELELKEVEEQKKALMQELQTKSSAVEGSSEYGTQWQSDSLKSDFEGSKHIRKVHFSTVTQTSVQQQLCHKCSSATATQLRLELELRDADILLKKKAEELDAANKQAENDVSVLKTDLALLQHQKAAAEDRAQAVKDELAIMHNNVTQLRTELHQSKSKSEILKHEVSQLRRTSVSPQEESTAKKRLEDELSKTKNEAMELRSKVEEVCRSQVKADSTIRNLNSQVAALQQEKSLAEHKAQVQKEEADSLRDQLKKVQEQITSSLKSERESIRKAHSLQGDIDKSTVMINNLKLKVEKLTRNNGEMERVMRNLKSENEKMILEKSTSQEKAESLKAQLEGLKGHLANAEEQLQKKTKMEQELQSKIRRNEEDLLKTKNTVEEIKIKFDEQKLISIKSEKDLRSLRSELSSVSLEKKMAEQKTQLQEAHIQELSSKLKNLQSEMQQKVRDFQDSQRSVALLLQECDSYKKSVEELKRKLQQLLETNCSTESEVKNATYKLITLQQEKRVAEEKVKFHESEISSLKKRLEQAQEDLLRRQEAERISQQKCRKLEDELQITKHEVEELRNSFNLQRKNYDQDLISSVMQAKSSILEIPSKRAEDFRNGTEFGEQDIKELRHEVEKLKAMNQALLNSKSATQKDIESLVHSIGQADKEKYISKHEISVERSNISELPSHTVHQTGERRASDRNWKDLNTELSELKKALSDAEKAYSQTENQDTSLTNSNEVKKAEVNVLSGKENMPKTTSSAESGKVKGVEDSQLCQYQKESNALLTKQATYGAVSVKHSEENRNNIFQNTKNELQVTQGIKDKHDIKHKQEEDTELKNLHEVGIPDEKIHAKMKNAPFEQGRLIFDRGQENSDSNLDELRRLAYSGNSNEYIPDDDAHGSYFERDSRIEALQAEVSVRTEKHVQGYIFHGENVADQVRSALKNQGLAQCGSVLPEDKQMFQGLRHMVSASQLLECKLLNADTFQQLQMGLRTIGDIQQTLEKYLNRATAIAGLYIEADKEKVSFQVAKSRGIIEQAIALEFLEAQAATGYIIDPVTGQAFPVQEAVIRGVIGPEYQPKLLEAEKGVVGYTHGGKTLSVFQAIEARLLERQRGKRILEAQIATGGIINPLMCIRVPQSIAVEQGLINNSTIKFLYEPAANARGFHHPKTKLPFYYSELIKMCVFDLEKKCFLLPFGERHISNPSAEKCHKISVVATSTRAEMTTFDAFQKHFIDRKMYLELSEQECEWKELALIDSHGNPSLCLTDTKTGRKIHISDALAQGVINKSELNQYKEGILTAIELADMFVTRSKVSKDCNSPIAGIWNANTNQRLSVVGALHQNLIDRITTLRLLEAQACTGGMIDPCSGRKYNLEEAASNGLLDVGFARQLQLFQQAFAGISHPQSKKIISVAQAVSTDVASKEILQRCLQFQYLTGGLIDPNTHTRISIEDSVKQGVPDPTVILQMVDEKSYIKCLTCPTTKKRMTYKEALEKAVFDCHTGLRLLEVSQQRNPSVSSRYYPTF
ncbi:dystonin isoform X3 [Protopterus annectens]|uniref:dystonin isoform X3 n=1 Tax=Protopterus annectens TaxID=7888 RepID=UPI001CFA19A3|nr:dystonin isoform X3 [Protopterus annectens]